MHVNYYRGYRADQRTSMDIYAESVIGAVRANGVETSVVWPESSLERYPNRLVMRALRYWFYPRSVANRVEPGIHHILDHGYAHLAKVLQNTTGVKTVINLHDLIPRLTYLGKIKSKSNVEAAFRRPRLNEYSLSFLRHADAIITISENTKADAVCELDLDPAIIHVIPPILELHFKPQSSQDLLYFSEKYGLDSKASWVMISGSEYYKNHDVCLQVLANLKQRTDGPIKILKTGKGSTEFTRQVLEAGLEENVQCVYLESFADMPLAYAFVDCLLFPSLYEGFGMPVAEALACGTPVVCSNRGSLPEVAPGLASYHDPFDVDGLTTAVLAAINDSVLRVRIREQANDFARQYHAAALAPKLLDLYSSLQ